MMHNTSTICIFSTNWKKMSRLDLSVGAVSIVWFTFLIAPSFARIQKECNTHLPRPTNLTLSTTKPGQYHLTWHWSSVEESVEYTVDVRMGPTSNWEPTTVSIRSLNESAELHKGLSFRVKAEMSETCTGNFSEEIHYIPEGVNGTAADNVSCVTYNTSSMNCTWIAGLKAPEDTQYNLTLTQNKTVEKCHCYQQDPVGRDMACHIDHLKIELNKETYILIEGQSSKSKIQFYDQWFLPYNTEVLNPPSDIKVRVDDENLTVQWKKPQTSYLAPDRCFMYEMSIQEKIYTPAYKDQSFTLPIQSFKGGEKYILKMRSRGYNCRISSEWGAWSGPITISLPTQGNWYTLVTILGITGASVLSSLLLVCLCKRFNVKQKIWPPIPQPRKSLYDFEKESINKSEVSWEENSLHPEGSIHDDPNTIDFENKTLR